MKKLIIELADGYDEVISVTAIGCDFIEVKATTAGADTSVGYEGEYIKIRPLTSSAETCVSCGEIIPEGRQVCPKCEKEGK